MKVNKPQSRHFHMPVAKAPTSKSHPPVQVAKTASAESTPSNHVADLFDGTGEIRRREDGHDYMKGLIADIHESVRRGEKVFAAFDIDDTLTDSRARTLRLAQEWDQKNGTNYFQNLSLEQVAHTGGETAFHLNLPAQVQQAFSDFWETAFWEPRSFNFDTPIQSVVDVAKSVKQAGGEVFFLTGRYQSLSNTSIKQLRKLGLPATHETVVCKPPTLKESTGQFKAQWLENRINQGHSLAFFITESRRDIEAVQTSSKSIRCVLVQSAFSGSEQVSSNTAVFIPHRRR